MARKKKVNKDIEQYDHGDKKRLNNPPVGLVSEDTEPCEDSRKTYEYDPHLDPQLQWAGKAEHTSFEVPTRSLHVHERIDPKTIIDTVQKEENGRKQISLFETEKRPLREAIEFYKHKEGWSNRMIAGDSLLVMNSLLEKEGMAGKMQMVYIDPPYGIKYGSNFQPFVNKRDVQDRKDEDLTAEPEMIKAFRDTWELGIHSYLTYLRDRLLLARELLTESGSVFVQISDENVHLVRSLMDEVFGEGNFVRLITFAKTGSMVSNELGRTSDYLLWYAREKQHLKYRQLFAEKSPDAFYSNVELADGSIRKITKAESIDTSLLPNGAKIFRLVSLESAGPPSKDTPFEFEGEIFRPSKNSHWKLTYPDGMEGLRKSGRIVRDGKKIRWKYYIDDYPLKVLSEVWTDTSGFNPNQKYVVETRSKVIQRCLLMTTDPGDLVFDPTCGSGTTAYVAEQWGRRWITCDTSRVALTLAKQRLMTANFDYYQLAHPQEGVGSGFAYKTVPHITLKSIANNEPPKEETLYDQPRVDKKKTRITGPFTVEAVPSLRARSLEEIEKEDQGTGESVSRSGETLRQAQWRDELLRTGVRAKGGSKLEFTRMEPLSGTRWIQCEAETKEGKPQKVFVVFGPEHAPLEQRMVENAWQEAKPFKPDMLLFCAFQFDDEAAKDIDELKPKIAGMQLLKVQMNADLFTDDLKKKRSGSDSFWLIGQPDVSVDSFQFLVFGEKIGGSYDIFKELSGLDSLAEISQLGEQDLLFYTILSQGRTVWHYLADTEGWDLYPGKYSRRPSTAGKKRIPSISFDSAGFIGRVRDFYHHLKEFGILDRSQLRKIADRLRGNSKITGRLKKIAAELKVPFSKNSKLTTKNFIQVEVLGFDYYNPKTGNVDSGGKANIAMWLLDTNYDDRSLFPSQVFFPMSGAKDGWSRLARNLKAEIDEEKIEAFKGTVSLPFEKGDNAKIAVKIIDDRGIESLRVISLNSK